MCPMVGNRKNENIHITPSKTNSTNIFGLMSLNNDLDAYSFKGKANSRMIIAFLDNFCQSITQPTVVVLDNAPIHHSKEFDEK